MNKSSFYCIVFFAVFFAQEAISQTNTFPTSGNVGIGTVSPAQKLHVVGKGLFSNELIVDYGTVNRRTKLTDNGLFMSRTSDGTYQCTIQGDGGIQYDSRNFHLFYINSILTLDVSETYSKINVPTSIGGVSSGDPSFNLFVGNGNSSQAGNGILLENRKASINGKNFLYFNLTDGNSYSIGTGKEVGFVGFNTVSNIVGVTNNQVITSGGSQFSLVDLAFRTYKSDGTYTERMRFTSDGNLGIGTSNTSAKLHIVGTSSSSATTPFLIQNSTTKDLLKVTDDATVLIGSKIQEQPGNLNVYGDIKTKKLKVTLAQWPDYVFHKKYELPTLEEVEKYINEHRHLPGVVSAEEVEREGLDVGDNQAVLLKKIEELTLYLIEQNKKLSAQIEKTSQLELEVEKLKNQIKKH